MSVQPNRNSQTTLQKGRSLFSVASGFCRDRSGTNAIEFGIVSIPFFALLGAIIEVSMAFFAGQLMDTGLNDAARLIRTGQAQTQSFSAARFKQEVCNRIPALLDCVNGLTIDVRVATNFSGVDFSVPTANGNFDASKAQFNSGGSSSIVVARAFYSWPSFTNLLGSSLSNQANRTILLVSTATFRNEPF